MKTKEEMIRRYDELYDDMATSKDVNKMHIFGEAECWMFHDLAGKHPEMADNWLSHLEEVQTNNYLSEREMMNISKRIINQDGSKGLRWSYEDVKNTLKELGGNIEDLPYYNCYAMVTTMGMIYSDFAISISMDLGYKNPKDTPMKEMALSCYRKAVEKLKDIDRPHFVREYFKGMMYDNSLMN